MHKCRMVDNGRKIKSILNVHCAFSPLIAMRILYIPKGTLKFTKTNSISSIDVQY
jgi:hypothetical protein